MDRLALRGPRASSARGRWSRPPPPRRARAGGTELAAITWIEGIPAAGLPAGALALLRTAASSGLLVVVVLPAGRRGKEDGFDFEEASRIAAQVDGVLLAQYLAEGSLISAADELPERLPARVDAGALADRADARAWLVLANAEPEARDGVADGAFALSLAPVHGAYLERLEQANAGLRRANARLARANLGRHDSSAASFAWQLKQAKDRISELNQELEQMQERLAMEVEIGIRNDQYFQTARAQLQTRPHQIAMRVAFWHRRISRLFRR